METNTSSEEGDNSQDRNNKRRQERERASASKSPKTLSDEDKAALQNPTVRKMLQDAKERAEAANKRAEAANKRAEAANKRAETAENRIYDESVKKLLENMPAMEINAACKPSIVHNGKAQAKVVQFRKDLKAWYRYNDVEKQKAPQPKLEFHEPAEIVRWTISKKNLLGIDDLNVVQTNGTFISSFLGKVILKYGNQGKLPHNNEVSPQDHLAAAIHDVVECLGLDMEGLRIVKEATLFSLRPDIVVVVYEGQILFAVEVKNPGDDESVFRSETAAGQVLDYLKGMRQLGVAFPFALLSTYNGTVFARLDEDETSYNEILQEGFNKVETEPKARWKKGLEMPKKEFPSPAKPAHLQGLRLSSLSTAGRQSGIETPDTATEEDEEDTRVASAAAGCKDGYDYQGRKVKFSQVFGVNDLYPLLALVLESSFQVAKKPERTPPVGLTNLPKEGAKLEMQEIFTAYTNGFHWERINVLITYNNPPRFIMCKKFHVICTLGQGGKGRTLLCCTTTGRVFAAKVHLIKPSLKYTSEDRKKEDADNFAAIQSAAEQECQRWKDYGPDNCQRFLCCLKLNSWPVVTMPYYPAIPLKEREDALPLIKAKLLEFAKEKGTKQGLVYGNADLRWRQFGQRWNGNQMEITLLDLESMVHVEAGTDARQLIKKQMAELEKRMGELDSPVTTGMMAPRLPISE